MPRARTDTRMLVVAGAVAVAAGILVALVLLLATGRNPSNSTKPRPLYVGQQSSIRRSLEDGGPTYYADPFGGAGFWTALERGRIVAVSAELPGPGKCTVRWRGSRNSFVDCHGGNVTIEQLARYPLRFPTHGSQKGGVLVDLRRTEPPAAGTPTTT